MKKPRLTPVKLFSLAITTGFLACTAIAAVGLNDGFESYPVGTWADGTTHGNWFARFNGYGYNKIIQTKTGRKTSNKLLEQAPQISTRADETHSSLVTSVQEMGDFKMSVSARTVKRLRLNTPPNNWEVDWVMWHITPNVPEAYYFLCKPQGWELGKGDPNYGGAIGQRFLATGSSPSCAVGTWHTYTVQQKGATMTVWLDGKLITTFTDQERPYLSGKFGLYNEDAQVQFDNFSATAL